MSRKFELMARPTSEQFVSGFRNSKTISQLNFEGLPSRRLLSFLLQRIFSPHSLYSLRSWRFFGVCVCVFFFLHRKVRDTARKLNRGRGSVSTSVQHCTALTLTSRTTQEHDKNRQLRMLQHKPTACDPRFTKWCNIWPSPLTASS